MTSKSIIFLTFHLVGAWAQSTTGACLDPQSLGPANKAACCSGSGNGEATVGTVLYEYTCNSYADNYYRGPLGAENAYSCAELCTKDNNCHASSWQPTTGSTGGSCWLSSEKFTLRPDQHKLWVILVNTDRAGHVVNPEPEIEPEVPAVPDCDEEVRESQIICQSEKDDLNKSCTSEKDDLTKRCTSEKDDLTKKCTSEKDDLTKKCTSEKDDLTKRCTSEKDDLTKKCTSEKDDLIKKLQAECQSKIKTEVDATNKCKADLKNCNNNAKQPVNQSSRSGK